MRVKWELSGRKLLGLDSVERGRGEDLKGGSEAEATIPSTTNVYSTRRATKGRNYCLLEKLYFATLGACRDNRLPNLKIYYLERRYHNVNVACRIKNA